MDTVVAGVIAMEPSTAQPGAVIDGGSGDDYRGITVKFFNLFLLVLIAFLLWPVLRAERGRFRSYLNRVVTATIVAVLAVWIVRILWRFMSDGPK